MDPIQSEHHAVMNDVAQTLDKIFKGYGWTLLVFDFGEKGRMNYISNAKREDMVASMREFIAKNRAEAKAGTTGGRKR